MDYVSLFTTQITDIFRLGLLAGLIYTTERTRAQTGIMLPLVAGILFVAVIIPNTMPVAGVDMVSAMVTGIVSNAVIVAVLWFAWSTFKARQ
jgi:Na+/glutamate symporter